MFIPFKRFLGTAPVATSHASTDDQNRENLWKRYPNNIQLIKLDERAWIPDLIWEGFKNKDLKQGQGCNNRRPN